MKAKITSQYAPAAVGPYSQAVETQSLVFLSGQIGLIPETGSLAEGGIAGQTKQALQNLQAVLHAAGLSADHVVKTTVFLTDMQDFKTVNDLYGQFFTGVCPARSCVSVRSLPLNALIEIEAIAVRP